MTDLRERSLAIIRAGQAPSGAFVACPTFSQYGYAWLRDGSFVAEALDLVGERESARRFHDWVAAVVGSAADGLGRAIEKAGRGLLPDRADYLHCRYRLDGTQTADDWPTFQLDGPGIWLWSLGHHIQHGARLDDRLRLAVGLTARYLAALWTLPCADAWEEFGEHRHTSTLAAILAGLRAVDALDPETAGEDAVRGARASIERHLVSGVGAWTKWDGSDAVDASLLWMVAPYGLVEPTHPRAKATVERIEAELVSPDGGVYRYCDDTYYGGGEWLLLTAALGRARLRRGSAGDLERAQESLDWIERQAGPDGSLPEQVPTHALDPSHIAAWRSRWGESASPLLWSHAAYLCLRQELEHAERARDAAA
jgi:GH15 family glucan-1,4-alpha-glucosidase